MCDISNLNLHSQHSLHLAHYVNVRMTQQLKGKAYCPCRLILYNHIGFLHECCNLFYSFPYFLLITDVNNKVGVLKRK